MKYSDQATETNNIVYEQLTPQYIEQAAQLCLNQRWNVDSKTVRGHFEDFPSGSLVAVLNQQVIGVYKFIHGNARQNTICMNLFL